MAATSMADGNFPRMPDWEFQPPEFEPQTPALLYSASESWSPLFHDIQLLHESPREPEVIQVSSSQDEEVTSISSQGFPPSTNVIEPVSPLNGISVDDFIASYTSMGKESSEIPVPFEEVLSTDVILGSDGEGKYEWLNGVQVLGDISDSRIILDPSSVNSDTQTVSSQQSTGLEFGSSLSAAFSLDNSLDFYGRSECENGFKQSSASQSSLNVGLRDSQVHWNLGSIISSAVESARTKKLDIRRFTELEQNELTNEESASCSQNVACEGNFVQTPQTSSVLLSPIDSWHFDLQTGTMTMPTITKDAQIYGAEKFTNMQRIGESVEGQRSVQVFSSYSNVHPNEPDQEGINLSFYGDQYPSTEFGHPASQSEYIQSTKCRQGCICQNCQPLWRDHESSKASDCGKDQVGAIKKKDKPQRPADLSSRLAALVKSSRIVKKGRATTSPKLSSGRPFQANIPNWIPREVPLSNIEQIFGVVSSSSQSSVTKLPLANTEVFSPTANPNFLGDSFNSHPLPLNGFEEDMLYRGLLALAEAVIGRDKTEIKRLKSLLQPEANVAGSPMQRILLYFMEALSVRMEAKGNEFFQRSNAVVLTPELERHIMGIVSKLPGLLMWCVTTNEAIFDAVMGEEYIHIVDVACWGGLWPPLLHQLASQTTILSMPKVKFTFVKPPKGEPVGFGPQFCVDDIKKEVLATAWSLGMEVEFDVLSVPLQKFRPDMVRIDKREAVAVSCGVMLSTLPDSSVVRWSPRDTALRALRDLKPRVLTICNIDSDFNGGFFLPRFRAAVHLFWAFFDGNELAGARDDIGRAIFEKVLHNDIVNVVACEGTERKSRCETGEKVAIRMQKNGFKGRLPRYLSFTVSEPYGLTRMGGGAVLQLNYKGIPTCAFSAWTPFP